MKKLAILLSSLVFMIFFASPVSAEALSPSIKVRGEGLVKVKPDRAFVNFRIETSDKSQSLVFEKNTKKVEALLKALKDFGLKEEHLVKEATRVYPIYNYDKSEKLEGYRAYNSIGVKLKDLEKLGKLLSLGIKAGADGLDSVEYSYSKIDEIYRQALEKAFKDGSSKAEFLGKLSGRNIKSLGSMAEILDYNPYVYEEALNMDLSKEEEGSYFQPSPKDIEVRARLDMEFLY